MNFHLDDDVKSQVNIIYFEKVLKPRGSHKTSEHLFIFMDIRCYDNS